MKSAFVTASISRDAGGLFFAMTSLARNLHQAGVDICTHGVIDGHTEADAGAWKPVPCMAHPRQGPAAIAYAPGLFRGLLAGAHELAHTHGIWQWPSAAVHRWHKKTGKPYLISPHGMLDPWAASQSRWKKRIVSALYESAHLRDAACIHALCESEAESIRAYGLKNPICVIPNGVDLPEESESLKVEGRRSADRKILLFLGRLHPKKGLVNALRAWHEIRSQGSGARGQEEWTFAIAGWDQGGHEAELKQLCDELGLAWADVPAAEFVGPHRGVLGPSSLVELDGSQGASQAHDPLMNPSEAPAHDRPRTTDDGLRTATPSITQSPNPSNSESLNNIITQSPNILFLGPCFGQEKDQLLRSADAFILPSFSEGLPMAVLEAMAYRLPVVMTDACNLPEGFAADAAIRIGTEVGGRGGEGASGRAGENAVGIVEGMRMLMEMTDAEREAMGARGRALVEQQFTWPQVAAQMKEVYEWILGGGAKPGCVRRSPTSAEATADRPVAVDSRAGHSMR